jgi:hypothetical protein
MERTNNCIKHSLQVRGYQYDNSEKFLMLHPAILKLCNVFTSESKKMVEMIMIGCYEHLKMRLAIIGPNACVHTHINDKTTTEYSGVPRGWFVIYHCKPVHDKVRINTQLCFIFIARFFDSIKPSNKAL